MLDSWRVYVVDLRVLEFVDSSGVCKIVNQSVY